MDHRPVNIAKMRVVPFVAIAAAHKITLNSNSQRMPQTADRRPQGERCSLCLGPWPNGTRIHLVKEAEPQKVGTLVHITSVPHLEDLMPGESLWLGHVCGIFGGLLLVLY